MHKRIVVVPCTLVVSTRLASCRPWLTTTIFKALKPIISIMEEYLIHYVIFHRFHDFLTEINIILLIIWISFHSR